VPVFAERKQGRQAEDLAKLLKEVHDFAGKLMSIS
jgi:hypothetical protein